MSSVESSTIASGNTKAEAICEKVWKKIKSRHFQLTLNEIEKFEDLKDYLLSRKTLTYIIACEEIAPTTGHKHIHIYIHFDNSTSLSTKKTQGAHIEICRGTPKQNIEYIRKDGNIILEEGEEPKWGGKISLKDMTYEEIAEECPILLNIKEKYDRKKKTEENFFNMLDEIRNENLKSPEVIYISGEPGEGKTYGAYKNAVNDYKNEEIGKISFNNGFADIVNENAKCFIIEEFRPSDLRASKLLELLDKYGASVNVKGGFSYLRPERIYICSTYKPTDIYTDEKNRQFLRRINKYYLAWEKELTENTICLD